MSIRTEYKMTEEQLSTLMECCSPAIIMMTKETILSRIEKDAYDAWCVLGIEMGFDHMTARSINGKGSRFFTAIPKVLLLPCPFDGSQVNIRKCVRDGSQDEHIIECSDCGVYIRNSTKSSTIDSWNMRKS